MTTAQGYIVLMGSGELTSTMVEVHKNLLTKLGDSPEAVFLDTPAGFQLNADQISQKAADYFSTRIQQPLSIASFKSKDFSDSYDAELAYTTLNSADYILVGPGSPTYAVRQWQDSPIPDIIKRRVKAGGCFVAASAAALTVGALTLPVYEIYKVGSDVTWSPGINILASFGLDLVVIPHWNNAEGGTHDTRFCYMGEPRFRQLEKQVPDHVSILGLDEHTACILDLKKQEAQVRGLGSVCIRRQGKEIVFSSGETFSLDVLRNPSANIPKTRNVKETNKQLPVSKKEDANFWNTIHSIESKYTAGIEKNNVNQLINALLDFDKTLWIELENTESAEFISQAREKFREMIVGLQTILASAKVTDNRLKHLTEELLSLRADFRQKNHWKKADEIRSRLEKCGIIIDDSPAESSWRIKE
jgi:peptidase E